MNSYDLFVLVFVVINRTNDSLRQPSPNSTQFFLIHVKLSVKYTSLNQPMFLSPLTTTSITPSVVNSTLKRNCLTNLSQTCNLHTVFTDYSTVTVCSLDSYAVSRLINVSPYEDKPTTFARKTRHSTAAVLLQPNKNYRSQDGERPHPQIPRRKASHRKHRSDRPGPAQ